MALAAFPGQLGVQGASSGWLVFMGVSLGQLVRLAGQPVSLGMSPRQLTAFPGKLRVQGVS